MKSSILKLQDVKSLTGKSRSSIYQSIAEGDFPRQINLGKRSVGWLSSEIDAWIESRVEASRALARSPDGSPRG